MRLATSQESRNLDQCAMRDVGLTVESLMETAGTLAAREIAQSFLPELKQGGVIFLVGPGNNGGDALVAARHLSAMGWRELTVALVAPESKRNQLMQTQLKRCRTDGISIIDILGEDAETWPSDRLRGVSLIVDGIFGTGLNHDLDSSMVELIGYFNHCQIPIVSLDIPSGLDSDRGIVRGAAVKARMTISFQCAKPGLFLQDGPAHSGRVRVVSLGIPIEIIKAEVDSCFAINGEIAHRLLPHRSRTSNKSTHGHVAVFAGRVGFYGAATLAVGAALRVGAGYVSWVSQKHSEQVLSSYPEALTASSEDGDFWSERKWSCAVIGPGLGVTDQTQQLIKRLQTEKIESVVVDADALTVIAQNKIRDLPKNWVLTPHAGELSRLIAMSSREIESDRLRAARLASEQYGCHVLLKGLHTVVARAQEKNEKAKCYIVLAGNAALAKAGTGDVLSGMIGGFMAQGLTSVKATVLGAFVHGKLADEWLKSGRDVLSLTPGDLTDSVPQYLKRLRSGMER